jgi:hypothetical protein
MSDDATNDVAAWIRKIRRPGPESSINGSIPGAYWKPCKPIRKEKCRRAALLQSPLTDSNRRPPPYHGSSGRYWQARAGTRGHVSPANRALQVCRPCPRAPARAQAGVPVSFPRAVYRLANRQPSRPRYFALRLPRSCFGLRCMRGEVKTPSVLSSPHGSAASARLRAGSVVGARATSMHRAARRRASGPRMKFSQRLCEANLGTAPIAIATAKTHVPHRNSAALRRACQMMPSRQSTISVAAT